MHRTPSARGDLHVFGFVRMSVSIIPEEDVCAALGAYGIEPDSVSHLRSGAYCAVYHVHARGREYVPRLRHPSATPAEVLFAARWTQAVSVEVPVPVSLLPVAGVPTIEGAAPKKGRSCVRHGLLTTTSGGSGRETRAIRSRRSARSPDRSRRRWLGQETEPNSVFLVFGSAEGTCATVSFGA